LILVGAEFIGKVKKISNFLIEILHLYE